MRSPWRTYSKNKLKFWLTIIIGVPTILALGTYLLPEFFWDGFLWRYFWGPVVADSKDRTVDGISSGYNWINTITYGIVLGVAFFGIYELIDHLDIEVDSDFVISLLPWILLGGSLRSLEDVGLFEGDTSLLFISPIIYFFLGIFAILTMVLGNIAGKKVQKTGCIDSTLEDILFRSLLMLPPVILFLSLGLPQWELYILPMMIVIASSVIVGNRYDWIDERYLFLFYSLALLSSFLAYNGKFILTLTDSHPMEIVWILVMAVVSTALLVVLFRSLNRLKILGADLFKDPLNVLLGFAHLFDASATFRGMEYYGYVEKHVVPTFLIDITGTPAVMFLMKLFLIILVVYVLDILYQDESEQYPMIWVFVKFVIITLGMAPAVRNTLSLAMGV